MNSELESPRRLVEDNPNLEKLNLSNNQISEITIIGTLENLQELFLENNQIDSFSALFSLSQLNLLSSLSLIGNPICSRYQYREIAIFLLPNLRALDRAPITKLEQEKSNSLMKSSFSLLPSLYKNLNSLIICSNLLKKLKLHEELKRTHPLFNSNILPFNYEHFLKEIRFSTDVDNYEIELSLKMDLIDDVESIVDSMATGDLSRYNRAFMDLLQKQLQRIEELKQNISEISTKRNKEIRECHQNLQVNQEIARPRGPIKPAEMEPSPMSIRRLYLDSIIENPSKEHSVDFGSHERISVHHHRRNEDSLDIKKSQLLELETQLKNTTSEYLEKEKMFTYLNSELRRIKGVLAPKDSLVIRAESITSKIKQFENQKVILEDEMNKLLSLAQVNLNKQETRDRIFQEIKNLEHEQRQLKYQLKDKIEIDTNIEMADRLREMHLKLRVFLSFREISKDKELNIQIANRIKSKNSLPGDTLEEMLDGFHSIHYMSLRSICFQMLYRNSQKAPKERKLIIISMRSLQRSYLSKGLKGLKMNTLEGRIEYKKIESVFKTRSHILQELRLRNTFTKWVELHRSNLRFDLHRRKLADAFYQHQSMKRTFVMFRRNISLITNKSQKLEKKKESSLMKSYFQQWRNKKIDLLIKEKYIRKQLESSILRRSIGVWKASKESYFGLKKVQVYQIAKKEKKLKKHIFGILFKNSIRMNKLRDGIKKGTTLLNEHLNSIVAKTFFDLFKIQKFNSAVAHVEKNVLKRSFLYSLNSASKYWYRRNKLEIALQIFDQKKKLHQKEVSFIAWKRYVKRAINLEMRCDFFLRKKETLIKERFFSNVIDNYFIQSSKKLNNMLEELSKNEASSTRLKEKNVQLHYNKESLEGQKRQLEQSLEDIYRQVRVMKDNIKSKENELEVYADQERKVREKIAYLKNEVAPAVDRLHEAVAKKENALKAVKSTVLEIEAEIAQIDSAITGRLES